MEDQLYEDKAIAGHVDRDILQAGVREPRKRARAVVKAHLNSFKLLQYDIESFVEEGALETPRDLWERQK